MERLRARARARKPAGSIDRTCVACGASSRPQLCSEAGRHPEGKSSLEAALGVPGEPQFLREGPDSYLCLNCLEGEEEKRTQA